jgi:hypothetical protein
MRTRLRDSKTRSTSKHADKGLELLLTWRRLRHASDRLAKTENVMEKYKKKLQEGADLRQHVKVCLATHDSIYVIESPSRWKNKTPI